MSRNTATASSFDVFGPDPLVPRSTPRSALAASASECDRDAEPTLTVSPEDKVRLLARAFAATEDDPTLEAPAPQVPEGIPSPLGDEPEPSTLPAPPSNEAHVRALVLAIWGVAVTLASVLVVYAMTT